MRFDVRFVRVSFSVVSASYWKAEIRARATAKLILFFLYAARHIRAMQLE